MARDYELDVQLTAEEINHKLSFVRLGQAEILSGDLTTQYPRATAKDNYIRLLRGMLLSERDAVYDSYWKQGFLGRFLVYLLDRII